MGCLECGGWCFCPYRLSPAIRDRIEGRSSCAQASACRRQRRLAVQGLTWAMVPLVRESLQLFGGRFAGYEIKKCLEDPTCPRLDSETSYKTLPAESVNIVV